MTTILLPLVFGPENVCLLRERDALWFRSDTTPALSLPLVKTSWLPQLPGIDLPDRDLTTENEDYLN